LNLEFCAKAMLSLMPRKIPDHLAPLASNKREVVDRRGRLNPSLIARQVERSQKPRPVGETGRGLVSGRSRASKCAGARTVVQVA
jgi:hypothetical protein